MTPNWLTWFVPISILIFSSAVNSNRFLEYETQVNESDHLNLITNNLTLLQTIITQFPSSLHVDGALFLGENITTGHSIWQWTVARPTALRMTPLYSKVGKLCLLSSSDRYILHNIVLNRYFNCF